MKKIANSTCFLLQSRYIASIGCRGWTWIQITAGWTYNVAKASVLVRVSRLCCLFACAELNGVGFSLYRRQRQIVKEVRIIPRFGTRLKANKNTYDVLVILEQIRDKLVDLDSLWSQERYYDMDKWRNSIIIHNFENYTLRAIISSSCGKTYSK